MTEMETRDSRPQTASEYLNGENEKDGGGDNESFSNSFAKCECKEMTVIQCWHA